jgi:DNA-binding LytR/AlgR family response regulator
MDRDAIIIFLTSHKKYVFKSFKIEPLDYITKPVTSDKIGAVLGRAIRKYRDIHHIVEVRWKNTSHALKVRDIAHLESYLRHVTVVTEDSKYKCVGKLSENESRLKPYGFCDAIRAIWSI